MLSFSVNNVQHTDGKTGLKIVGSCKSTDDKPLTFANGSELREIDTGKLFVFNEAAEVWSEKAEGGGGGGGDNTLAKAIVDRSVTEIKESDLSGITTIGTFALSSCAALISAEIPEGVTLISNNGFYSCGHLESVTIPSTVTRINSSAFQNCSVLAEIHIKAVTPPALPNANAFSGISQNAVFFIPKGTLTAYQTATNWASYSDYMQEES